MMGRGEGERRDEDNAEALRTQRFAERRNPRAQSGVTVPQAWRDGQSQARELKRDSSLRGPTRHTAARKKKSGRSARNDV